MIALGTMAGAGVNSLGVFKTVIPKPIPGNLGSAYNYSVVGSTINNSGITQVNKSAGTSAPNPANSGMIVSGMTDYGNALGQQACADTAAAYTYYNSLPHIGIFDADLAGKTFTPGVYFAGAAITNSGVVNLDGTGHPADALFVFQIGAAFAPAADSSVNLINCNANQVVWSCVGAPSTGARSAMVGTLISVASITMGINATINGRVLAHVAAVTLSANQVVTT